GADERGHDEGQGDEGGEHVLAGKSEAIEHEGNGDAEHGREGRAGRSDAQGIDETFDVRRVLREEPDVREGRPAARVEERAAQTFEERPHEEAAEEEDDAADDPERRHARPAHAHGALRASATTARYCARSEATSRLPSTTSSSGLPEASAAR